MRMSFAIGASVLAVLAAGCATAPKEEAAVAPAPVEAPIGAGNPFFAEAWTTPFAAPPFNEIKAEHYGLAFEEGMKRHRAEVAKVAAQPEPATFANTIEALEVSGRMLTKTASVFFAQTSTHTSDALDALELELSPKLAAHQNAILQDPALFARVDAVYAARDTLGLTSEQKRLLTEMHGEFVRAGARLDAPKRARMAAIDSRLAELSTQFGQNQRADERQFELVLDKADLAGLPESLHAGYAETAKTRGHEDKFVVTLQRPSVEPFLQFSSRRDLREKAWRAWAARGDNADAEDNNALIVDMVKLRTERAQLLGFPNHAAFALDDRMAKTPEAARALMEKVWTPAKATALREARELQAQINREKGGFKLAPWDWRYYAEKVRAARYNLDPEEVRPYFELNRMLEASFWTAEELFGVTVTELKDVPVYDPDVRVFEMKDKASGKHLGIFYGDFYAKSNKQSGAWMTSYRDQKSFGGDVRPVAAYHLNYTKPPAGQPTLLTYDDAETLFHEFGHVLHGVLSNVTYETLAGTSVARDYVEFPSTVLENWVLNEKVLDRFARHAVTGTPMPKALVEKILRARNYGQGFDTVEYLASAVVDMDLHSLSSAEGLDPKAFEKQSLARLGMPSEIIMRHRLPHFGHLFAGGYSAGYYSYLWSDVLASDAYEAFSETGNVYDPAVAASFKTNVFMTGNARSPMDNYVAFRGRPPETDALLRSRGFAPAKKPAKRPG
jgi:peptidyl-dipeptidase Dcp